MIELTYDVALSPNTNLVRHAVAEHVFGYQTSWWSIHPRTDLKNEDDPHRTCISQDEVMLPDDKGDCPGLEMQTSPGWWCRIPDYVLNADAGMTIPPRMNELGWLLTVRTLPAAYTTNTYGVWAYRTTYQVQFWQKPFSNGPDKPIFEGPMVVNDNLFDAICRAALLALLQEIRDVNCEDSNREWRSVGIAYREAEKVQKWISRFLRHGQNGSGREAAHSQCHAG